MEIKNGFQNLNMEMALSTKIQMSYKESQGSIEVNSKEDAKKLDAKALSLQYTMEFQLKIEFSAKGNFLGQGAANEAFDIPKIKDLLKGLDLGSIGYSGKPIEELKPDEAKELVGDNGFFGIEQTAKRIADFVILGSGGDEKMLKAGREGALRGFKEAESLFGGKLPDMAYETINKALAAIDKIFEEKGIKVLDAKA